MVSRMRMERIEPPPPAAPAHSELMRELTLVKPSDGTPIGCVFERSDKVFDRHLFNVKPPAVQPIIRAVDEGSAAATAGLSRGDVVLSINGVQGLSNLELIEVLRMGEGAFEIVVVAGRRIVSPAAALRQDFERRAATAANGGGGEQAPNGGGESVLIALDDAPAPAPARAPAPAPAASPLDDLESIFGAASVAAPPPAANGNGAPPPAAPATAPADDWAVFDFGGGGGAPAMPPPSKPEATAADDGVARLVDMGFAADDASAALVAYDGDVEAAVEALANARTAAAPEAGGGGGGGGQDDVLIDFG